MDAGGIVALLVIAVAIAALAFPLRSRIFTRDFWRPEPALAQLVGMLLLVALGVAAAVGMLYLLVWLIHTMWRAT